MDRPAPTNCRHLALVALLTGPGLASLMLSGCGSARVWDVPSGSAGSVSLGNGHDGVYAGDSLGLALVAPIGTFGQTRDVSDGPVTPVLVMVDREGRPLQSQPAAAATAAAGTPD